MPFATETPPFIAAIIGTEQPAARPGGEFRFPHSAGDIP
jgi:hypothetical protein